MAGATTHEAAEVQQRSTGTYIYGLVPADVEVSEDVLGVGDPPGEVRLVRHGEIAALVSEVPLDGRLGTPTTSWRTSDCWTPPRPRSRCSRSASGR